MRSQYYNKCPVAAPWKNAINSAIEEADTDSQQPDSARDVTGWVAAVGGSHVMLSTTNRWCD